MLIISGIDWVISVLQNHAKQIKIPLSIIVFFLNVSGMLNRRMKSINSLVEEHKSQ